MLGIRCAILLAGALIPFAVSPCSCRLDPLSDVYARSDHVFSARVVDVRLKTVSPVHNELAQYIATFEVRRVFKGKQTRRFEITFEMRYHAPGHTGDITIGHCNSEFEVGEKYLFLRNGWDDFQLGYCSSQLHPLERIQLNVLHSLAN